MFFFPIALSTFISVTVASLYDSTDFKTIQIAIVDNPNYQQDETFKTVLESASSGENALFQVQVVSEESAIQLLKDDDITGYILRGEEDDIVKVNASGMNQTILQSFMNEYKQQSYMIQDFMKSGANPQQIMESFKQTTSFIEQDAKENADLGSIYMFSILAMTMLYGVTGHFIHVMHKWLIKVV